MGEICFGQSGCLGDLQMIYLHVICTYDDPTFQWNYGTNFYSADYSTVPNSESLGGSSCR